MDDRKIPYRRNVVLTRIFNTYRRPGGVGRSHESAVDKKSPQHPYLRGGGCRHLNSCRPVFRPFTASQRLGSYLPQSHIANCLVPTHLG